MARAPLPYIAVTNLTDKIVVRRAEMIQERDGREVFIKEVEHELATYCDVTRDTIIMIKRGLNQPSLAVAMKIAEYFKCQVEDIFKLEDAEEV